MEGGAEYFSLTLFSDFRWWKETFIPETETYYWNLIKNKLYTTDQYEKNLLCYGNPKQNIPYLAGYSFGYHLFLRYMEDHPTKTFQELLEIDPYDLIDAYQQYVY